MSLANPTRSLLGIKISADLAAPSAHNVVETLPRSQLILEVEFVQVDILARPSMHPYRNVEKH